MKTKKKNERPELSNSVTENLPKQEKDNQGVCSSELLGSALPVSNVSVVGSCGLNELSPAHKILNQIGKKLEAGGFIRTR